MDNAVPQCISAPVPWSPRPPPAQAPPSPRPADDPRGTPDHSSASVEPLQPLCDCHTPQRQTYTVAGESLSEGDLGEDEVIHEVVTNVEWELKNIFPVKWDHLSPMTCSHGPQTNHKQPHHATLFILSIICMYFSTSHSYASASSSILIITLILIFRQLE